VLEAMEAAGRISDRDTRIAAIYNEQSKLTAQKAALAPWLELDIPLETASTQDVAVFFGTVAAAVDLDALEGALNTGLFTALVVREGLAEELLHSRE